MVAWYSSNIFLHVLVYYSSCTYGDWYDLYLLVPYSLALNLEIYIHSTLPITKKYVEILLHYRQLFVKGNVIIGEWGIFCVEIFHQYSQFFIKSNFILGRVECTCSSSLRPSSGCCSHLEWPHLRFGTYQTSPVWPCLVCCRGHVCQWWLGSPTG